MLSPKRSKFRKQHKGRIHGLSKGGTELNFGSFGLKALAREALTLGAAKLPIRTKFVARIGDA
jgi:large subunit ribosomal protein L16